MPSSPVSPSERRRLGRQRARAITLVVAGGSLVAAGVVADITAQSATHKAAATSTSSTASGASSSTYSAPTSSSSSAQVSSGAS
jgi:uncharacterized membrane protein